MNRRMFLIVAGATAAAAIIPHIGHASDEDYRPGLLEKHLAADDTVFLDFKASWCSTCRAQGEVLSRLKAANPEYEKKIVFINVDWDTYGKSELVSSMRIPRRSTLVVLKGDQELGRIVAQTDEASIRALMDTALAAAAGT